MEQVVTTTFRTLHFALGGGSPARKRRRCDGDETIAHHVSVKLVELINQLEQAESAADLHFGLFVWPSALVLAHYVAFHNVNIFGNCTVLELGCGTALPGIVAAVCGNPRQIILSDREDSANIRQNAIANIELNRLQDVAVYLPLTWGGLTLIDQSELLGRVDIALAADCFYQSEDFECALATVAFIFRLNPNCIFITTYHLRSINRSIAPLLSRYRMKAKIVDKTSFVQEAIADSDSVYLYEISPE